MCPQDCRGHIEDEKSRALDQDESEAHQTESEVIEYAEKV